MDQQKIELRKIRDFGENINSTFQFIKQELKPLLKSFFAITGIVILITGVVGAFYQADAMSGIFNAFKGIQYKPKGFGEIFNFTYFLFLLLSIFNFVLINVTIACYVKIYGNKAGVSPTIEEVWNEVVRYIIPIFFYTVVLSVLIIIGCLLCLVPGIYLAIVFVPINYVMIIEDASFGTAFNRCFTLIKENFWLSFGLYIVVYLIYSVSSGVIGLAISAVAGLIAYFTTKDIGSTVGVVTGFLSIFQHLFYIIFSISIGLHYYNLVEQKDGEGLLSRIESLGSDNDQSSTEEQF